MPLNDKQIKALTPSSKDQWVTDEKGLRLLVKPNGGKYWRFKYRFDGKQKTLAIGVYGAARDAVSLAAARDAVIEARLQLRAGVDPSTLTKAKLLKSSTKGSSFEAVALMWWEIEAPRWKPAHAARVWQRLKDNAFPSIGATSVEKVAPQQIISIVQAVEARGSMDVAKRLLQDIGRVYMHATIKGMVTVNPATGLNKITTKVKTQHRPSLPPKLLGGFLRDLDTYTSKGRLLTKLAMKLLVLTFVRPGELRQAEWIEFDIDNAVWNIPSHKMKMGRPHVVPLSRQALEVLAAIEPLTRHREYVFPSERGQGQPMSDNTLRKSLQVLGYSRDSSDSERPHCVPHGFRATASSSFYEAGFRGDVIEAQLAHQDKNQVRAAYAHHAMHLDARIELMQWWSDHCDAVQAGADVVPLFRKQQKAG
jgi:integrase